MAAIFESHGQDWPRDATCTRADQSDERVVTRQAEILTEAALKLGGWGGKGAAEP